MFGTGGIEPEVDDAPVSYADAKIASNAETPYAELSRLEQAAAHKLGATHDDWDDGTPEVWNVPWEELDDTIEKAAASLGFKDTALWDAARGVDADITAKMEFKQAKFGGELAALGAEAACVRAEPPLAEAELTNAAELAGAVAVIGRGGCTFVEKARRAQAAGAVGVIIVNTEDTLLAPADDGSGGDIRIPVVGVATPFSLADAPALLAAVAFSESDECKAKAKADAEAEEAAAAVEEADFAERTAQRRAQQAQRRAQLAQNRAQRAAIQYARSDAGKAERAWCVPGAYALHGALQARVTTYLDLLTDTMKLRYADGSESGSVRFAELTQTTAEECALARAFAPKAAAASLSGFNGLGFTEAKSVRAAALKLQAQEALEQQRPEQAVALLGKAIKLASGSAQEQLSKLRTPMQLALAWQRQRADFEAQLAVLTPLHAAAARGETDMAVYELLLTAPDSQEQLATALPVLVRGPDGEVLLGQRAAEGPKPDGSYSNNSILLLHGYGARNQVKGWRCAPGDHVVLDLSYRFVEEALERGEDYQGVRPGLVYEVSREHPEYYDSGGWVYLRDCGADDVAELKESFVSSELCPAAAVGRNPLLLALRRGGAARALLSMLELAGEEESVAALAEEGLCEPMLHTVRASACTMCT